MNRILLLFLMAGGFAFNPYSFAENAVLSASATPAPSPALEPIKDSDKKKLLSDFQKALSSQKSALARQEKLSFKELSASQNSKIKKWREEQKQERRQFFEQHMSGPERRDFVQSYLKIKAEFDASVKAEYINAKKAWMEKSVSLRSLQKDQEAKFNSFLSQGFRPPADLWPAGN